METLEILLVVAVVWAFSSLAKVSSGSSVEFATGKMDVENSGGRNHDPSGLMTQWIVF